VDAFYRWWTCKEAFVKNSGDGLVIPLDWFDAAVTPHKNSRITRIK
jgi:phosphopantetheinyl transferase